MGAGRLEVRSADGTPLAVWVEGEGPPLVLVHGSMCDHTAFDPLVAELGTTMTTFAMDRRGFGASGDAAGYALEREFEDVAAVVEAVAARAGGPVALWGHSYRGGLRHGRGRPDGGRGRARPLRARARYPLGRLDRGGRVGAGRR
jgi:pimeloyl-ACP methyl ester carboxylesterase